MTKCLSLVPIIVGRCFSNDSMPINKLSIVLSTSLLLDETILLFVLVDMSFGRVHYFVKLITLRSCGPSFYALVKVMERSSERSDHIPRSSSERHMVALRPSCGQLIAVNVKDITDVCVCVCSSK